MAPKQPLPRFDGYLFDLDGTLVDTAPDLSAALSHALASEGLAATDIATTRDWVGHGARVLIERAAAAQSVPLDSDRVDRMHRAFLDYYRAHIADRSQPYPGVLQALEALERRGARLAVVTNKPEALSQALLNSLNLEHRFAALVGGDTARAAKPAADPAMLAAVRLELRADQLLFVGDSGTDVGCARAFGCPVACVTYGYRAGEPLDALGADWLIDSLEALL